MLEACKIHKLIGKYGTETISLMVGIPTNMLDSTDLDFIKQIKRDLTDALEEIQDSKCVCNM